MRICYVAADVAVPHYRGSSTHVYELARNLVKLGHEVHVVARRVDLSQQKEEVRDGISIHRFQRGIFISSRRSSFADMSSRGSYQGSTPSLIWKSYEAYLRTIFPVYIGAEVARIVKKYSIDLIFERESSFGAGAMASVLTGRPFVLEVIGDRVTRFQVRRSKRIIAYSGDMFAGKVEASRVEVVTGAVDTETFKPDTPSGKNVRVRYALVDSPVVGYVGTFQEWHGLDELIRAAAQLIPRIPQLKFLMVGPYYRETEARVLAAGIGGSFVFTGPVSYEQVPSFMNASDVLVAPYNPDKIRSKEQVRRHGLGSPLKVFEYMAVGRPVITTDVKPISDPIENGVTGYLVPPGDSDALASAILSVLRDRQGAEEIGAAGRRSVIANYSWGLVAKELVGIFQDVLDSSTPRTMVAPREKT